MKRIAILIFFGLIYFSSALVVYKNKLEVILDLNSEEITQNLLNGEYLQNDKRVQLLKNIGFEGIRIFSSDEIQNNTCVVSTTRILSVDGYRVGKIVDCATVSILIKYLASSPIFIFIFIIFIFVWIIPLFQYKRKVSNFINALEKNQNINFSTFEYDPVTSKILYILKKNLDFQQKIILLEESNLRQKLVSDLAQQVSHDIRSPLSALNMTMSSINNISDERRLLINNAVQRINDIANDLLFKSRLKNELIVNFDTSTAILQHPPRPELISSIVDQIISEKRIQFRDKMNIQIQADIFNSYGGFVEMNSSDLKRILSNLVNNSVDAFSDQKGEVTVSVRTYQKSVQVVISDNGCGIASEHLVHLGEKGFTVAKDGNGLGLYHAKKTIENIGGTFDIISKVNVGTTVTVTLKRAATPDWFVENLLLSESKAKLFKVVTLDNDSTIHQIWDGRFKSLAGFIIEHLSFTSANEFIEFCNINSTKDDRLNFLIDFELLGQSNNGLEIIESLKLFNNTTLVSNRFEEDAVLIKAKNLGIRILPKSMISSVSILPMKNYDAVLIDDDELVHLIWRTFANEKGKTVGLFKTYEEFLIASTNIEREVNIYVDVNLGNGVDGIQSTLKIHDLGFTCIHLTTGYEAGSLEIPGFIKGVVGKDPAF